MKLQKKKKLKTILKFTTALDVTTTSLSFYYYFIIEFYSHILI